METLRAPAPMDFSSSDLATTWKKWKKLFKIFSTASELSRKDEQTQVATFLNVVGTDAIEVYDTFNLSDSVTLDEILQQFDEYCEPKKNIVFERYKFWSRKQCDGESAKEWITALKGKASSCEFGEQKDQLIRDKIVFDINDKGLKERMLRESQLSLEDAIAICNTVEASRLQLKEMENS